jgi:DNA-binding response OmpR family regulator
MQKRILVVSHDKTLRDTRSTLLLKSGYTVATAEDAETALLLLENNTFDLILVGRTSQGAKMSVDQQLRQRHPELLILKIADLIGDQSSFASHESDSVPTNVLAALKGMVG